MVASADAVRMCRQPGWPKRTRSSWLWCRQNRCRLLCGCVTRVSINLAATGPHLDESEDGFTANAEFVLLEQQIGDPRVRGWRPSVPQGDDFVLVRNQGRLIGFTNHSNQRICLGLNRSMLLLCFHLTNQSSNKAATEWQEACEERQQSRNMLQLCCGSSMPRRNSSRYCVSDRASDASPIRRLPTGPSFVSGSIYASEHSLSNGHPDASGGA